MRVPAAESGAPASRTVVALGVALGVAFAVAGACSRPRTAFDAGLAQVVVLRSARPPEAPPRRLPSPPSAGTGGYDLHPRQGDDGYGYEFSDTWLYEECARFAACDLEGAFARAERALQGCYALAPVPGGKLVGDLTLRLVVSYRGAVRDSEIVDSATGSAELDDCMARGLRSAEFRPAEDGSEADTVLTWRLRITKAKE
ncbi:MAG: hypothetical protein HY908_11500 [Myxococcales bacterium]|nr:hypothetical protein [Myxococcales bacterium]